MPAAPPRRPKVTARTRSVRAAGHAPARRSEVERLRERVARLERALEKLSARPSAAGGSPPRPAVHVGEDEVFAAEMRRLREIDPPGGLLEEGEEPDPEKVREIVAWAEERRAEAAGRRAGGETGT